MNYFTNFAVSVILTKRFNPPGYKPCPGLLQGFLFLQDNIKSENIILNNNKIYKHTAK